MLHTNKIRKVFCAGSSNKGIKPKIFIALFVTSFAWMNIVKKVF
jgi:hypothetical protein